MAVNSCLILLLQSSFSPPSPSLSLLFSASLFFFFPLHPPYVSAVLPACLFMRWGGWQGLVLGQDNNSLHLGADTDAFKYAHTHTHTHRYKCGYFFFPEDSVWVCLCKRTTGSPFAVWMGWGERQGLCMCVCGCVLVLLQQSSSLVEQSDWQTQTCLSLFVSFWTHFLWASFPLLIHYCTAANLGASVKHLLSCLITVREIFRVALQFHSRVKAMINQLFRLPLFIALWKKGIVIGASKAQL